MLGWMYDHHRHGAPSNDHVGRHLDLVSGPGSWLQPTSVDPDCTLSSPANHAVSPTIPSHPFAGSQTIHAERGPPQTACDSNLPLSLSLLSLLLQSTSPERPCRYMHMQVS